MKKISSSLVLILVAVSSFWQQVMPEWSSQIIYKIILFFFLGFLIMRYYKKSGSSDYACLAAASLWISSLIPQASMLKNFCAIMPLVFAMQGFGRLSTKPMLKFFFLFLFFTLHLVKYFSGNSIINYALAAIANFGFYFLVARGIDIVLSRKEELRVKIVKAIKPFSLFILPFFYSALLYLTAMYLLRSYAKQLYFFFTGTFNIISLELLFLWYLAYLLKTTSENKEPIELRLFTALILESLSISYLIQYIVKFN